MGIAGASNASSWHVLDEMVLFEGLVCFLHVVLLGVERVFVVHAIAKQ
jgi:hypothetical protein